MLPLLPTFVAVAVDFPTAWGDDLRLGGLLAIGTSMAMFAVLAAMAVGHRSPRFSVRVARTRRGLERNIPALSMPPSASPDDAGSLGATPSRTEVAREVAPHLAAPPSKATTPHAPTGPAHRPQSPLRSGSEAAALGAQVEQARLTDLAAQFGEARRASFTREAAVDQIYALAGYDTMVERDVDLDNVQVPFVILGPTGVFAVLPTDVWRFEDLACTEPIVRGLRRLVGHLGIEPQVIFYNPFGAQAERSWFDSRGRGAWVVGAGQLRSWLDAQPGPGVGIREIALLREAAKPRWDPPAAVIAPSPTLPRG